MAGHGVEIKKAVPIAWNGSDGRAAKAQALFIRKYGKEKFYTSTIS